MNFTFTWILDKFGFQAKPAFDFPVKKEPAAKKVAKKTVKIAKATTRKTKTK
jgi:hypothetical protein